jgi:hypothetical protein
LQSHNKVICGQKIKNLRSNFLTTIPNSLTTDRGRSVATLCSLRLTQEREVYMARLLVHRLYKFVMVLTLFVSVGMAALLFRHYSAPQAAEIPSASGHGELPLMW